MKTRDKVLEDRYLQKGETENDMYQRVAQHLATTNQEAVEFYDVMSKMLFLPNTPTLINAGSDRAGGYSACYVLPIDDDIDSIYKTLKDHALIHKAFGGTGLNFSKIRPEGDTIKSTGGRATGPIGFIKLFDANASAIKQGGHREGANMAILNVSHPDIEKFIDAEFDHFNSSVGVTDCFMEAVRIDNSWRLHFDGKTYGNVGARELFTKICEGAWKSGNPGIVFLDRIQEFNPTPGEVMDATNPCGEQMLLPYESCNLGSINLSKMVVKGEPNTVDWEVLGKTVRIAVDMLDAVISKNEYPLEEVREKTLATRKIGLGVMGWHDMLIHMGISYDSSEALDLADKVMEFITNIGVAHSIDRGVDIGVFPNWENSIWNDKQVRMRNATVTTIAPTGTLSIIAECSSGIEPVYDWEYVRKVESGTFVERHPTADLAEANGLTDTAKDISWKAHIRMQAAFQKHVHNAVSKTINMKNDVTVGDVKSAYVMAYDTKCKGVTIYRDGSRDEQVLSSIDDMKHNPPLLSTDGSVTSGQMIFNDTNQPLGFVVPEQKVDNERPKTVSGKTTKCTSGCGSLFVTTNVVDGKPYELFVHHSDGGCQSNMEAIGRLISLALKEGIEVDEIVGQLSKIKCSNAIRSSKSEGDSCSQIIGKQLMESNRKRSEGLSEIVQDCIVATIQGPHHEDDLFERILADSTFMDEYTVPPMEDTKQQNIILEPSMKIQSDNLSKDAQDIIREYGGVLVNKDSTHITSTNKCPECGDKLDFGEGCNQGMCRNCGWSGCN